MKLTEAQVADFKAQGWTVLGTTFALGYKSQWDTPWFIIREFYQNALDEHDVAQVSAIPSLELTSEGLVIQDKGRGLGAESLLMSEVKQTLDLRGRFGEGMKFACIAAVRMGYTPIIETPKVSIRVYSTEVIMGGKSNELLTFVYKENARPLVGTKIVIPGYHGSLYKERFVQFLPAPLFKTQFQLGRFARTWGIWKTVPGEGRLYVGDIFIRTLDDSAYMYNVWGLDLNPDRISEVDNYALRSKVGILWAYADTVSMAGLALSTLTTEGIFESQLNFPDIKNPSLWKDAWSLKYGSRSVLFTGEHYRKMAESFGYEVVGQNFPYNTRYMLKHLITTDEAVTVEREKELSAPKIIADKDLPAECQVNLAIVRFLSEKTQRNINAAPKIVAAEIPPDPRTGTIIFGLCDNVTYIYLAKGILYNLFDTISTFCHEMGHWMDPQPLDGTIEHTNNVQAYSAQIFLAHEKYFEDIMRIQGKEITFAGYPKVVYKPIPGVSFSNVYPAVCYKFGLCGFTPPAERVKSTRKKRVIKEPPHEKRLHWEVVGHKWVKFYD
jgi:hypothetical protein